MAWEKPMRVQDEVGKEEEECASLVGRGRRGEGDESEVLRKSY